MFNNIWKWGVCERLKFLLLHMLFLVVLGRFKKRKDVDPGEIFEVFGRGVKNMRFGCIERASKSRVGRGKFKGSEGFWRVVCFMVYVGGD